MNSLTRMRNVVTEAATMGLCSQTHHEHVMRHARDLELVNVDEYVNVRYLPLGFSRERWANMSSLVGHVRLYGKGMIPDHPAPEWLVRAVEHYDEIDARDPIRGHVSSVDELDALARLMLANLTLDDRLARHLAQDEGFNDESWDRLVREGDKDGWVAEWLERARRLRVGEP